MPDRAGPGQAAAPRPAAAALTLVSPLHRAMGAAGSAKKGPRGAAADELMPPAGGGAARHGRSGGRGGAAAGSGAGRGHGGDTAPEPRAPAGFGLRQRILLGYQGKNNQSFAVSGGLCVSILWYHGSLAALGWELKANPVLPPAMGRDTFHRPGPSRPWTLNLLCLLGEFPSGHRRT